MNNNPHTILNDYKNAINCKFDNLVNDIVLFGSQLNSNSNSLSDYDILIILNTHYDWKLKNEIDELCYIVDLKHNIVSDTHILSVNELNTLRGKQPIFINALNNGLHA